MTATRPSFPPPRVSSDGVSVRPSTVETPRTSNIRPLAQNPSTRSVGPPCDRSKEASDHANTPAASSRSRSRTCSQMGLVHPPSSQTSCWGSRTGSDFKIRLLRIEKSAVLAPMPSASERTAIAVTIGVARSDRQASRQSIVKRCRIVRSPDVAPEWCRVSRPRRAEVPNQTVVTMVVIQNPRSARRPRTLAASSSRQKA